MYKQELPRDFKSKYEFNSGVTTHEKTYVSTPAIYFPESIRQEGDYVISNETGYRVCVATPRRWIFIFRTGNIPNNRKTIGILYCSTSRKRECNVQRGTWDM